MLPSRSILSTLLALTIGLVPLLCCCGSAEADEVAVVSTRGAGDHACCEPADEDSSDQPKPADSHRDDCGCETHLKVMQETRVEAVTILSPAQELPCFTFVELPRLLTLVDIDAANAIALPKGSDASALPAAPTLRTLSVLLLT